MTVAAPGTVAVVGLGLIGASLCLALRRHLPAVRITGIDVDEQVTRSAESGGVCDRAGTAAELLGGSELIVLAAPLDTLPSWVDRCHDRAPGTPVTDCGSTKAVIVDRACRRLGDDGFLGGHPMAGSERRGLANADPALFEGCTWVLTPRRGASTSRFRGWIAAVEAIGARVEMMDPVEHDEAAAWASHLPFSVSAAVVLAGANSPSWPAVRRLASTGYRDVTRLASGAGDMYRAIAATNAGPLRRAIDGCIEELVALREAIGDGERIEAYCERARARRQEWLEERGREGRAPW